MSKDIILLDGKRIAKAREIFLQKWMKSRYMAWPIEVLGRPPVLAICSFSDDPASKVYVKNKIACAERIGIRVQHVNTGFNLEAIKELGNSPDVDGIIVQLPLPDQFNTEDNLMAVFNAIPPEKDVDGLTITNMGRLCFGGRISDTWIQDPSTGVIPCTPKGIISLLKAYGIIVPTVGISGKKCVVVGRSRLVGIPLAHLLLKMNGTVTVCHSHTANLAEECRTADILVSAVGKPKFITADMIKGGAVVVDVGINRLEDGSLCGDVDFDAVKDKVSAITPVPGGVGPMTVISLMENTISAYSMAAVKAGVDFAQR